MAVLPACPNINVRIGSQGTYLNEYLDQGQDKVREDIERASSSERTRERTTSRYIEAVTDAQFDVILYVKGPWSFGCASLGFEVLVDGKHIETTVCLPYQFQKSDVFENGYWHHVVSGEVTPSAETGMSVLRRFKFSGVTLVDDHKKERVAEDAKRVLQVGSIVVRVHRMSAGQACAIRSTNAQQSDARTIDTVSEKALKGRVLSHAVAFGERERLDSSRASYDAVPIDGHDNPTAVFRFRYRSKETLESLSIKTASLEAAPVSGYRSSILPSNPSIAAAAPSPDLLAGLSPEELETLAREQLFGMNPSTLTLKELETLAAEHDSHIDFSKVSLKVLRKTATDHLIHKQCNVSDLPYQELKRLASERLKSRDAATKKTAPTENSAAAASASERAAATSSNVIRHRSFGLNAADDKKNFLKRRGLENILGTLKIVYPQGYDVDKIYEYIRRPEARIYGILETDVLRLCQDIVDKPLSDKSSSLEKAARNGAESVLKGMQAERILEILKADRLSRSTNKPGSSKLTGTNPKDSRPAPVKSEPAEKTSVSSFLKGISRNTSKGSKRNLEDSSSPEKPSRPYKVTKKRSGAIMVDLTEDD